MYMLVNSQPPATGSPLPIPGTPGVTVADYAPSSAGGMSGYKAVSPRARLSEFYPPPYGFIGGMGCPGKSDCGCGGKCGGCGDGHGMGLFDSGTDISGWGLPEWGLLGVGAFALFSMTSSVSRGARSVRRTLRRRRA